MTAERWNVWTFPPAMLAGLAIGAFLYARGLHSVWSRGRRGRVVAPWRGWCVWGGMAALVAALVSPVDELGAQLFAMHVVQNIGRGWRRARILLGLWGALAAKGPATSSALAVVE